MQIKRKSKIYRRKSLLLTIGSLLLIVGIMVIFYKIYTNYNLEKDNNHLIEEFITTQTITNEDIDETKETYKDVVKTDVKKEDYIAVIEIPKINLKAGMYDKSSKNNNVDKNIEILKESDMPNVENGNFIIAGHSGTGRVAYFKNLNKVNIDDKIYIYYNNKKYIYKVSKIYDIKKNGYAQIQSIKNKTNLTLITCRYKTNNQIVIISELINTI